MESGNQALKLQVLDERNSSMVSVQATNARSKRNWRSKVLHRTDSFFRRSTPFLAIPARRTCAIDSPPVRTFSLHQLRQWSLYGGSAIEGGGVATVEFNFGQLARKTCKRRMDLNSL
ncbi:hypothetical protein JCGZ_03943 [Jatropha curcas]|uniref:Uncharacterized protein n=1 Tax=Jatropha curcas TaxID=180498 RepID=A0A067JKX7_JATCU|nr:hypothetical protein JCGZ_03943 [Jatropha curcas]